MSAGSIFLVDDNADDRDLFLLAAKKAGLEQAIEVARDGQEALDLLLGRPQKGSAKRTPDLMILDLKMPRVGGLDVLRAIRADRRLRHLMVIVLTSSDEERDRSEAGALGATAYRTKPDDFDGYVSMAKEISGLLTHL
ncbi:MAG TPA: response regulator [Elusimicrobiota bacterium]|nr:response regulator [Elusimicrobiota bacterium]